MFGSTRKKDHAQIATLENSVRVLIDERAAAQADLEIITSQRDRMAAELTQIKAAMNEVAVYEGIVDVSPVAMLVSELVRDHEELEARIDAVVLLLKATKEHGNVTMEMVDEVTRLLRGGKRVPDTPEELTQDDD
jgi:choline dehydrogenase-like flavoprotein